MVILSDHNEIKASSSEIFNWFISLDKNYHDWHPDHINGQWIKGNPGSEGSVFYAEEYIHGKAHKIKFEITKIIENRLIKYKFKFPTSLICSGGTFLIDEIAGGCVLTSQLKFRFGKILKFLAKKRFLAFDQHFKEESTSLKQLLESEL